VAAREAEGVPEFATLIRAPLWLIGLLLLAAIFIGVYAYFTTPLPYGLGEIIKTPGGANTAPTPVASSSTSSGAVPVARTAAGQPLVLGAASVSIQAVQRNEDLTAGARGGPPGTFTVLDVTLQNAGTQPLTPQASDFQLVDDRGRVYAIDTEATRSENTFGHRRDVFQASVPPGSQIATFLAFETPADATNFSLRVSLGYGEVDLPRQ
jgi:hypothetical protein